MLRIAVPDLISNSYFPIVVAVEGGFLKAQGVEARVELLFPVDKAYEAMRDGQIDVVGGSAHSAVAAFPDWRGVKLLCAQAQGMYWFLVMRSDLATTRGDVSAVKGRVIGAAPWVEVGLRGLLREAGIDLQRDDVQIRPVPPSPKIGPNFGLAAAKALEEGKIDGFWANGMGAEVAVESGAGRVVLDVRRGDGPKPAFEFTFASVAATDDWISRHPDEAAAVVRAVTAAQAALRADTGLAYEIGKKVFPPAQAELIERLIERDLPFYDPAIRAETVAGMNAFAVTMQLQSRPVAYEDIVATRFAPLWHPSR